MFLWLHILFPSLKFSRALCTAPPSPRHSASYLLPPFRSQLKCHLPGGAFLTSSLPPDSPCSPRTLHSQHVCPFLVFCLYDYLINVHLSTKCISSLTSRTTSVSFPIVAPVPKSAWSRAELMAGLPPLALIFGITGEQRSNSRKATS